MAHILTSWKRVTSQSEKYTQDLRKIRKLNKNGTNWFLAFFRGYVDANPWPILEASLSRSNGLKKSLVKIDKSLVTTFNVYRPNGQHDPFGAALLRGL